MILKQADNFTDKLKQIISQSGNDCTISVPNRLMLVDHQGEVRTVLTSNIIDLKGNGEKFICHFKG